MRLTLMGVIGGDKNIANEFNKYFSEIGKKLGSEIPRNDMDPLYFVNPVSNLFTLKSISKEDLYRSAASIKFQYLISTKFQASIQ